ncbi:MAG: TlpA family protein disulfide reductase [Pseudomonadota bacterium]|nr:TlpA family protein disulfide reductase [Pseudomonadota bacterium]
MMSPALRIACAASLVVGGVWAGAWVYRSHVRALPHVGVRVPAGQASAPNPSDLADVSQGASPAGEPAPGAQPASKIPEHLPPFSLANLSGKLTAIGEFAGKSLVINFWATWCAPCQREIPLLQALHSERPSHGIEVVGIAVDFREKVREFANRFKIRYPLLLGDQDALDVAAALGVAQPVFPFTVFTDHRGQVVALFVGELHRPQADLILDVVQKLDQDLMALAEARRVIATGLARLP